MIILLVFIQLMGCFLVYTNSQKTVYRRKRWENFLRHQKVFTTPLGVLLLIGSHILFRIHLGWAAGLFFWMLSLMAIFSLLILVRPLLSLDSPKKKHAGK